MAENTYTCAHCARTFVKGWSDEDANQEYAYLFPDSATLPRDLVCDDCFHQLVPRRLQHYYDAWTKSAMEPEV